MSQLRALSAGSSTPEQCQALGVERDYARAVWRLRAVALRLLWRTVRRDPEVLAEYVKEAREALTVIEAIAAPRRSDVTLHPRGRS